MSEPGSNTDKASSAVEATGDQQVVVLPPETVKEAAKQNAPLTITIAAAHAGPLPPPAMLREYNQVIPGLGDTIVNEFKSETSHRRKTQRIAQIGAIVVAVLSIICGLILGIVLKSPYAALSIIAPVCGIVGTAQLLQLWLKT
jgi:uncharacterized membrane protein